MLATPLRCYRARGLHAYVVREARSKKPQVAVAPAVTHYGVFYIESRKSLLKKAGFQQEQKKKEKSQGVILKQNPRSFCFIFLVYYY